MEKLQQASLTVGQQHQREEREEREEDDPRKVQQLQFHGDILQAILSHVSLLDFLSASLVSKTWWHASTLSSRRPVPCLVLHLQPRRDPSKIISHAYSPISRAWIRLPPAPHPISSSLRSSHPNLLYTLSSSQLSLSFDALGSSSSAWRHLRAPTLSRIDPVVAVVGSRVVVVGGTWDFEGEPRAVETCSLDGSGSTRWEACDPIPETFEGSSYSASWMSVAVSDQKLYLLEKNTGWFCAFDPEKNKWSQATRLLPPQQKKIITSAIGYSDGRLILIRAIAGGGGAAENVESVGLWELEFSDNLNLERHKPIGEMPAEMVSSLVDQSLTSIGFLTTGALGYVYNASRPKDLFVCEFNRDDKGRLGCSSSCRWERVSRLAAAEENPIHRAVLACSVQIQRSPFHALHEQFFS